MAKKKVTQKKPVQSKDLYYKGKKLNKFFKEAVEQTARIKKVKVNTPTRLKTFYESNKDKFGKLFEMGLETSLNSSTKVFDQFDKAEANKHEFFIEKSGKVKPTTAKDAKFELAKLEQQLNVLFGSTGVEYSYKKKLDNTTIISLPDEEELEELQGETTEDISDYLSEYGIKIYTSDKAQKKYKENETRRKSYTERTTNRFKEFRKERNKERKQAAARSRKRKEAAKNKTKRGKRK